MDLGIDGKTALVMGAGGGLGSAIGKALAREGCRVILADLDLASAERAAAAIAHTGGVAHPVAWDLSDVGGIEGKLAQLKKDIGPIDILVNNSGGPRPGLTSDITEDEWRGYFDSMVLSLMRLTRLVVPDMQARRWGRVITSTSSGVVTPIPGLAVSNSLRLALVGWSKSLAQEVAKDGVTVNVAIPGRIATPRIAMLDQSRAKAAGLTPEAVAANSTSTIPAGRYGEPDEYANAVVFLASQCASYITGTSLRVDGGLIPVI